MKRRDFLLRSCQACAAMAIIPTVALTSCGSAKGLSLVANDGAVQVPLAQLDPSGRTVVNAKGAPEKFMVVKHADGTYSAIVLNCTHKSGPVREKDGKLVCSWHGSAFDMEGRVTKGPAKTDLVRYTTELSGEMLNVKFA